MNEFKLVGKINKYTENFCEKIYSLQNKLN